MLLRHWPVDRLLHMRGPEANFWVGICAGFAVAVSSFAVALSQGSRMGRAPDPSVNE